MDTKTVICKFVRDDKKEFIIDGSLWGITSLDGIAVLDFDIFSEKKGVGYGERVTGKRVGSRDIVVKAKTKSSKINDVFRDLAVSFFLPTHSYDLFLTYLGKERWISGEIEKFKCPSKNVYLPIEVQINMFCADPCWKSIDEFGKNIASETPMFSFPYIEDGVHGVNASISNFAQEVQLYNDGDVETYCTAVISAKGNVTNPSITVGGKFIRIKDTMEEGDIIVIDIENAKVYKNETNIITKVDRQSTFVGMQLAVGTNTISFDADNGSNLLDVYIYYNKLYMGV